MNDPLATPELNSLGPSGYSLIQIMESLFTLSLAAAFLFLGKWVLGRSSILRKLNLPEALVGGLIGVAGLQLLELSFGWRWTPDRSFQTPLMVAFFALVGWSVSLPDLLRGGYRLLIFFAICCGALLAQTALGLVLSPVLNQPALLGLVTGPAALTGGPGTTLAFAPLFEKAGVVGAQEAGLAAALAGILLGGLLGPSLGVWAARGFERGSQSQSQTRGGHTQALHGPGSRSGSKTLVFTGYQFFLLLLISMGLGSFAMAALSRFGVALPVYLGAMLLGAIGRTAFAGRVQLKHLDEIAEPVLALFITLSVLTLDFGKLRSMGFAVAVLVFAQLLLTGGAAFLLGRRFARTKTEAALYCAGFFGFMMGTTANALANMQALIKGGPGKSGTESEPQVFVPLVGACLIDFVNAAVLSLLLGYYGSH